MVVELQGNVEFYDMYHTEAKKTKTLLFVPQLRKPSKLCWRQLHGIAKFIGVKK